MSSAHPIIVVTGSSGAGRSSVTATFARVFGREGVKAAFIDGAAFHRYERLEMRRKIAEAHAGANTTLSRFGPEVNLFTELEAQFRLYGETGRCLVRKYLHDSAEAAPYGQEPGTFTSWEETPAQTDVLFYEGLHGGLVTDSVNVAQHVDLLVGVVPMINLEWIQKLHRDKTVRGYSHEAVVDTILRRLPDYTKYICPQFTLTDVNFQRVPIVDTSNPFSARSIPTPAESMLVIRFKDAKGIDFPYLRAMLHDSFMSGPETIVCPGGKMGLAMQLIFAPMLWKLMDRRKRLVVRGPTVKTPAVRGEIVASGAAFTGGASAN